MIFRRRIRIAGLMLLSGTIILSIVLPACRNTPAQPPVSTPVVVQSADTIRQAKDLYGLPWDLYLVEEGKVRRNQTLSDLLKPLGFTMQEIYKISLLPDSLINERKIKQGNRYLYYSLADTTQKAPLHPGSVFIYEKDLLNFVVISIDPDTIWARNGRKPVDFKQAVASGTIETSLWESMLDIDVNPMLAVELSEIFAWSIDFFGLQQGDRYKIIYEESFVDSSSLGINKIIGAWMYHSGTDFWAIPFVQDSIRSFFDEEGNRLWKREEYQ